MAKRFSKKQNKHQKDDASALNILAMATHYSPNPKEKELGIDLPFNYQTGEISETVWNRWLGWDPIRLVHKYQTNLKKLKFIYIDCGRSDEYNLIWGARILHSKLERLKISHFYEEFDDGHMNINYRYKRLTTENLQCAIKLGLRILTGLVGHKYGIHRLLKNKTVIR